MLEEIQSKSFEKSVKSLIKKHYDFTRLFLVINMLKNQTALPNKFRNHYLKGDMQGYQECHIENDLLLIYKIDGDKLFLAELGTHSDLF